MYKTAAQEAYVKFAKERSTGEHLRSALPPAGAVVGGATGGLGGMLTAGALADALSKGKKWPLYISKPFQIGAGLLGAGAGGTGGTLGGAYMGKALQDLGE